MSSAAHDLGTGVSGRRFLIHACLGRGGFGEVYRATMTSAGGVRTEVAIKVLRADIDPGSDSMKRLRDEGRLLGALSHPAIPRVHDLVLLDGRVALVTEFVEGEDLDSCLASEETFPVRVLVAVLGEVASALDVAWNTPSPQGGPMHLVHRDIKPANIRLGRHGEVKLLDFGIARATNLDREAQTANNAMLGSYLYMAPERFHEEQVEPPSDVYALGCILYEGLTKHRLFEGMTLKQIYGTMLLSRKFNSHVEERMRRLPADTPPSVVEMLRSLLEVDPATRPSASTVARLSEDLVETLSGPTLKRWARAREWPQQAQTTGTLDGCELSAESFDVSDSAVAGTPAVARRAEPEPAAGLPSPEPAAASAPAPAAEARAPEPAPAPEAAPAPEPTPAPDASLAPSSELLPPVDPVENAPVAEIPVAEIPVAEVPVVEIPVAVAAPPAPEEPVAVATAALEEPLEPPAVLPARGAAPRPAMPLPGTLPGPDGSDGLDAPVAGLVSREMARFTPAEMEEAKAEAERSMRQEVPLAPSGPRPTPLPSPPRLAMPHPPTPQGPAAQQGIAHRLIPASVQLEAPRADDVLDPLLAPTPEPPPIRPRPVRLPDSEPPAAGPPSPSPPPPRALSSAPPAELVAVDALVDEPLFSDALFSDPEPPAAPSTALPDPEGDTSLSGEWFVGSARPRPVEGEIPQAPEPIPGVLEDETGGMHEQIARSQRRRLANEQRQRRALWAVVGMAALGLVAIGTLGYWVYGQLSARLSAETDDGGLAPRASVAEVAPVPADPVRPNEAPEPAAAPEHPEDVAPEPAEAVAPEAVAVEAEPEIAPRPIRRRPKPEPAPAPAGPTVDQLIYGGWKRVDEDAAGALAKFDAVLASDPKNAEALYGRGYALLKLSRRAEAVDALCRAQQLGDASLGREVRGILKKESLGCP